ncbi:MAG: marR [Candidatus Midichloriaceae bacterium]|nr:marR [Candidatus Midichloriaceae bacterium]
MTTVDPSTIITFVDVWNIGVMMRSNSKILKQHIGYWLNRLRNVVHYTFESCLAQYGVSVAEWSILVSIYDGSANSVNDIAAYIEIDKASISRVTERLAMKGMLYYASGQDRRSKILGLTKEGRKLTQTLLEEAEENDHHFFGHLSQLEQEHMRSIIHSVLQQVPTINLDGWIILNPESNKNNEVIMKAIVDIRNESKKDRWPYPKTFQVLKDNGLQNYEVHFADYYRAEFNGDFGSFTEEPLEGYSPIKANEHFNAEGIKNAVIKHAIERTPYLDFLQNAAANGATHYKVDMDKRTVTYFNADESVSHIEYVPNYEQD